MVFLLGSDDDADNDDDDDDDFYVTRCISFHNVGADFYRY